MRLTSDQDLSKHKTITKQLSILLADDDKDDRFFFDKALKELSIPTQLKTVEDGELLMGFLSEHVNSLPDVLFLDLNMPRKTGNECLTEIKYNEKLKQIPVIIYSTSLQEDVADELYKIGAHYYLQKCNYKELIKSLQQVLKLLEENPTPPSRDKFIIKLKDKIKH